MKIADGVYAAPHRAYFDAIGDLIPCDVLEVKSNGRVLVQWVSGGREGERNLLSSTLVHPGEEITIIGKKSELLPWGLGVTIKNSVWAFKRPEPVPEPDLHRWADDGGHTP